MCRGILPEAKEAGFADLSEKIAQNTKLKAGDRIVANNMGKGMALFVIGKESMEKGMNILGAHIDSPRLDLNRNHYMRIPISLC